MKTHRKSMRPHPKLEQLAERIVYGELENWEVPNIHSFSTDKKLYDYQTDALRKAAQALRQYYSQNNKWSANETPAMGDQRKRDFADLYIQGRESLLKNLSIRSNRNPHVFRILSEFIAPEGDVIPYHNLINRMCFWMATGSGKTLVMVKLIEYLHSLKRHGEIPPHDVLILAPGEQLLRQIKRTVDEFNFDPDNKLKINLIRLRDAGRQMQTTIYDSTVVYYHDSRNISDVEKTLLTNYRTYERDGEWYVILDEAHKGGKENSKRQAYYAVMARSGFLFNFSATFTDEEDILTTVKKYNLEDFVRNGYGKNVFLNRAEYGAFKDRGDEINEAERLRIVLKSLIALAYLSKRVKELRKSTGSAIYHLPLMLTLANSVNPRTNRKNDSANPSTANRQNDLWNFFQVLLKVVKDKINKTAFTKAKTELISDWGKAEFLFSINSGTILDVNGRHTIENMSVAELREEIFFNREISALEYIHNPKRKEELAFKSKGADTPFALICIGETSKWKKDLLVGYQDTTSLHDEGFFESLDQNRISILMGSRKFVESWDTNRPNIINFINIGSSAAKKYVMQSIGRGVRIEPLPNKHRRLSYIPLEGDVAQLNRQIGNRVTPIETLFLFATNRADVESVLTGIKEIEDSTFMPLFGFEIAARMKRDGKDLPLLVPEYKAASDASERPPFAMSTSAQKRFRAWVNATSDSVFAVRDGIDMHEIRALREIVENGEKIRDTDEKVHTEHDIALLQARVISHNAQKSKISNNVKKLDKGDIVHFKNIRVHAQYAKALGKTMESVKEQIRLHDDTVASLPAEKRPNYELHHEVDKTFLPPGGGGPVKFARIAGHYYLPMILWENERPHYMQHIISAESEIRFVNELEKWVKDNPKKVEEWTWMFSKIDESLDNVYIPYYDNAERKFFPDFVFWLWREGEYRIVFVDPKTTEYTAAEHKIDGYDRLFMDTEAPRTFSHGKQMQVSVRLLMFNNPAGAAKKYRGYWTNTPARIFAG